MCGGCSLIAVVEKGGEQLGCHQTPHLQCITTRDIFVVSRLESMQNHQTSRIALWSSHILVSTRPVYGDPLAGAMDGVSETHSSHRQISNPTILRFYSALSRANVENRAGCDARTQVHHVKSVSKELLGNGQVVDPAMADTSQSYTA